MTKTINKISLIILLLTTIVFLTFVPNAIYPLAYIFASPCEIHKWYPQAGNLIFNLRSCFDSILCLICLEIFFVGYFFLKRKSMSQTIHPLFAILFTALIVDNLRGDWSMFSWCFFESEWKGLFLVKFGCFCSLLSSWLMTYFFAFLCLQRENSILILLKFFILYIICTLIDVQIRNLIDYSESLIFLSFAEGIEITPAFLNMVNTEFLLTFDFCFCAPDPEVCAKEKVWKETMCTGSKFMKWVKPGNGGNIVQKAGIGILKYEAEQKLAEYCQKLTEYFKNCRRNSKKDN